MRTAVWVLCVILIVGGVMVAFPSGALAQETPERKLVAVYAVQDSPGSTPELRLGWPSDAVEALFWRAMKMLRVIYWITIIAHVLLALWVLSDPQSPGSRKLFFAVLTLLTGFCGAALYALVRIGDKKA